MCSLNTWVPSRAGMFLCCHDNAEFVDIFELKSFDVQISVASYHQLG